MSHFIIWWFNTDILPAKKFSTFRVSPLSDVSKSIGTVTSQVFLSDPWCPVALITCSYVAQWLSIALAAQKVVGSIPREHTCNTQKCIKVSAKCINVNAIIQILKAGNLSYQLFITHTNQDEDEGADEGVIDNPPGFPYTPPGVDILEGGKLTSNNVVASGAVSKPGGDTAGQDALHSAGVEGSEDAGAHSKLPQPSQEEETLMCLLQQCVCVSRPCEILGDVNAEELKAVFPLHRCLVDGDGCVFSALSPVIHHQLLGLVDVEWEVVLLTPFSQGTHLLSVGRLIVVSDQAYHVVSSANLTMTLELCVWLYSHVCTGSTGVGWGRSPEEHQCWGSGEMRYCCPFWPPDFCLSGSPGSSWDLLSPRVWSFATSVADTWTIIHEQHSHIGVLNFPGGREQCAGWRQ